MLDTVSKNAHKNKKVAVGLSGGVDSSVAAHLLLQQGYTVVGVHMQCWDYDMPGCRGHQDRSDAIKVAALLDIPFVDLNFETEYKEKVLGYFFNEVKEGRTPNPDIMCNTEIKFGLFLNWARENNFDFVATGHYARIIEEGGIYELHSGADMSKDQSYFLYRLGQNELKYSLYPLGTYEKKHIREIAEQIGLPVFNKPDSTGICFVGDIDIKDFIKSHIEVTKGAVLDIEGNVIGEHEGIELYTIGQRHGFTLSKYAGLPLYVIKKIKETNSLIVGFGDAAQFNSFNLHDISWVNSNNALLESNNAEVAIRIRNLGDKMPGIIKSLDSENLAHAKNVEVKLKEYTPGLAPGQSGVLYVDSLILGGGIIE